MKDKVKKCKRCKHPLVWCNSIVGRVLWCVNVRCPLGPIRFESIAKAIEQADPEGWAEAGRILERAKEKGLF